MNRRSSHRSWADNHLTAHEQTLRVWHPFLFILLRLDQDELEAVAGQVPLLPALRYAILSADLILCTQGIVTLFYTPCG